MTDQSPFTSQSGGMFFYILLGVALFAALSYAVATSMRGGGSMTTERAKLTATEFIDMGTRLADATARLKLKGCRAEHISFEQEIVSGYDNTNSPADKSCHVFDYAGGGLSWELSPESNSTYVPLYSGQVAVPGVGTDYVWNTNQGSELMMFVQVSSREVCMEIDRALGIPVLVNEWQWETEPLVSWYPPPAPLFDGSYLSDLQLVTRMPAITPDPLTGKKMGCYLENAGAADPSLNGPYRFYTVLLAR